MNQRFSAILTLSMVLFISAPAASSTVQVKDVHFPTAVDVNNQRLHLQGAAVLKYMVFIDAYAGALYLPADAPTEAAPGPRSRARDAPASAGVPAAVVDAVPASSAPSAAEEAG